MIGHRMSALPEARFCAKSPLLAAAHGSSMAALISQCYHAKCAQMEGWRDMLDRLPGDIRADVESWPAPPLIEVPDHEGVLHTLDYGKAEVELFVGLDGIGFYSAPGAERTVTEGHIDMAWHFDDCDCAFVGDVKRSRWTCPDYDESLQLHAYGLAYAGKWGLGHYRIGIWTPMEEEWWWSEQVIAIDSRDGARHQAAVTAAALNRSGEAVTGLHCRNCWGRAHCPEFLLPAALGCTKLRAACEGQDKDPTDQEVLEAFQEMKALDTLLAVARPALQSLSDRRTIIDPATGKQYYSKMRSGKESVKPSLLREKLGKDADQYITRGAPYPVYDWYKPRQ